MNTLKKIVSAVVVSATALTAAGAAAQAGDWSGRSYGYGHGYGHGYRHAPSYHGYAPRQHYGHGHHHRRDRTGERIAAGVAIGVGAVILGSIIANQNRRHYRGY